MNFALLCNDSSRSRCYRQNLCKFNFKPSSVILMSGGESDDLAFSSQADDACSITGVDFGCPDIEFDPLISVAITAKSHGLKLKVVNNVKSANSKVLLDYLESLKFDFYILSGWSGDILAKDTLARLGRVLHVHSGRVPDYKGSTTAYYSLLEENMVAACAFFMTEGIDEGKEIETGSFKLRGAARKMDHIFDPLIRSAVLVDAIRNLSADKKKLSVRGGEKEKHGYYGNYFVIHPLLKKLCFLIYD